MKMPRKVDDEIRDHWGSAARLKDVLGFLSFRLLDGGNHLDFTVAQARRLRAHIDRFIARQELRAERGSNGR